MEMIFWILASLGVDTHGSTTDQDRLAWERIIKAFSTSIWIQKFPNYQVRHLLRIVSDCCLLSVITYLAIPCRPLFRFEKIGLLIPNHRILREKHGGCRSGEMLYIDLLENQLSQEGDYEVRIENIWAMSLSDQWKLKNLLKRYKHSRIKVGYHKIRGLHSA